MRRAGTSIFVFLLAALVLLGSGGFTVGRMVCAGNGHVSYSIGHAKDCCEKKGMAHKPLKKGCCNLKNISLSLDHFSFSQKTKVSPQPFGLCSLPTVRTTPLASYVCRLPSRHFPPPDTKDRLHLTGALLL
jgi:hypothetical protein